MNEIPRANKVTLKFAYLSLCVRSCSDQKKQLKEHVIKTFPLINALFVVLQVVDQINMSITCHKKIKEPSDIQPKTYHSWLLKSNTYHFIFIILLISVHEHLHSQTSRAYFTVWLSQYYKMACSNARIRQRSS